MSGLWLISHENWAEVNSDIVTDKTILRLFISDTEEEDFDGFIDDNDIYDWLFSIVVL